MLVLLVRPVVFLLLAGGHAPRSRAARLLISWFGPRGLSTLLLVLLPVFAGLPGSDQLFALCALVVLFSVALHGGSLALLLRKVDNKIARRTASGDSTPETIAAAPADDAAGAPDAASAAPAPTGAPAAAAALAAESAPATPPVAAHDGAAASTEPVAGAVLATASAPAAPSVRLPGAPISFARRPVPREAADGASEDLRGERITLEAVDRLARGGRAGDLLDVRTDRTYDASDMAPVDAIWLHPDLPAREAAARTAP